MSKQKLTLLGYKLKQLAILGKDYTDDLVASEKVYLIEKASANTGYFKTYILAAGVDEESEVIPSGSSKNLIGYIDIPKDYLVKSANVLTVEEGSGVYEGKFVVVKENNVPVTPYEAPSTINAAGEWLDFVVNCGDGTDTHLSVNLSTFLQVYTGGSGIDITNNVISIDLSETSGLGFDENGRLQIKIPQGDSNGLSFTESGLTLTTAQPSEGGVGGSNGAMSAQDKEQLDKSNIDLLTNAEIGSWYGYAEDSDMVLNILPNISDDSITDE